MFHCHGLSAAVVLAFGYYLLMHLLMKFDVSRSRRLLFTTDQNPKQNAQTKAQDHQPEIATNSSIFHSLKGNSNSKLVKFELSVDNTGMRIGSLSRVV